jgi:hypothetical protein
MTTPLRQLLSSQIMSGDTTPLRRHLADLFARGLIDGVTIESSGFTSRVEIELGGLCSVLAVVSDDFEYDDPRLHALTSAKLSVIRRAADDSEDWRRCPTAAQFSAHALAHPCGGPSDLWLSAGGPGPKIAAWGRWHVRRPGKHCVHRVGLAGTRPALANGDAFAQDLPGWAQDAEWLPLTADGDVAPWPEGP